MDAYRSAPQGLSSSQTLFLCAFSNLIIGDHLCGIPRYQSGIIHRTETTCLSGIVTSHHATSIPNARFLTSCFLPRCLAERGDLLCRVYFISMKLLVEVCTNQGSFGLSSALSFFTRCKIGFTQHGHQSLKWPLTPISAHRKLLSRLEACSWTLWGLHGPSFPLAKADLICMRSLPCATYSYGPGYAPDPVMSKSFISPQPHIVNAPF